MQRSIVQKVIWILGILLAVWLGLRYLLPVLMPFLLGAAIAAAAEPAVRFGSRKFHLPRPLASGLGVSVTLAFFTSVLWLVGALAVRELGSLAGKLPDVESTVDKGMLLLQDWAVSLTDGLPEGARTMAANAALELFNSKAVLQGQVTRRLPNLLRSVLGWLPGGALGLGTGILASFMLSVRLPKLRQWVCDRLPAKFRDTYLPALRKVRHNLFLWLKAQMKLSAVTYGIVTVGFLLMRIPYGPFWAVLIAFVDAVPVLGTGTVLLPWALIEFVQGDRLQALGLVLTYAAALLSRTVLEPRLVGRQLGLDPLLTLLCLYAGFRFWGIPGMILAPVLATAIKGVLEPAA